MKLKISNNLLDLSIIRLRRISTLIAILFTLILFQMGINLSITPTKAVEVGDYTPPSSGSWIIDELTVVENREILLNGSIRILSNGNLTLDNVTLRMNSDSGNNYNVTVYNNGALYTKNNATITAYDTQYHWYFSAADGAIVELQNSTFLYGGLTSSFEKYGLWINSSYASIEHCRFNHMFFGIIIPEKFSHGLIINNTFNDCTNTAIHVGSESLSGPGGAFNVTIEDNSFNNTLIGIHVVSVENVTIKENNITESSIPLYIQDAENITMIKNCIIDSTQSGIHLEFSNNCTIISNTIIQTSDDGVRLRDSHDCIVEGNYFKDISESGINKYEKSGKVNIQNNTIENAYKGISAELSSSSIISNNNITDSSNSGIHLLTSGNSIISNNRINNSQGTATATGGIHLEDSPSSTLDLNVINNSGSNGIYLDNCDSSNITNNKINGTGAASRGCVWLLDSNNVRVTDNVLSNSAVYGIYLQTSPSGNILRNNITNTDDYGIYLYNSGPCTVNFNNLTGIKDRAIEINDDSGSPSYNITGNWISGGTDSGIRSNRGYCTIFYNTMKIIGENTANGIELSATSTIFGNTIENFRNAIIVVSSSSSNSNISENVLINSTNTAIALSDNPYIDVIGNTITDGCSSYGGISLEWSGNSKVMNNDISFISSYGIKIYESPSTTVSGNTITNTSRNGIILQISSQNGIIANNTVTNCSTDAIAITDSSSTTIDNNTVKHINGTGISSGSPSCTITRNTVTFCDTYGISFGSSSTTISDNTVKYINGTGIGANGLSGSITRNNVTFCDAYGIYMGGDSAIIWYNYLANNAQNAGARFTGATWDNGSHGNWYDDYTGPDWDQDGIGDLPYVYGSFLQDNYPLVNLTELRLDVTAPTIDTPSDKIFEYNPDSSVSAQNNITWNPMDLNPVWYTMTVNGTFVEGVAWTGGSIVYMIKNIIDEYTPVAVGVYNYTITVFDRVGNNISDSVLISIVDTISSTISTTPEDSTVIITTTTEILPFTTTEEETLEIGSPGFSFPVVILIFCLFSGVTISFRRKNR